MAILPKPKVYVETSILSYLAARPSRDRITGARQVITRRWWDDERRILTGSVNNGEVLCPA